MSALVEEGSASASALELRGICKSFYGLRANDDIDFRANWGQVHALLGENGAGKTTLCSILAGLYRPDSGQVLINGRPVEFRSPRDAYEAGVGMVYQHFRLIPTLTVAENLALGHPGVGWRLSRAVIERKVAELSERFGLRVDPRAQIWQISVGEQQRVEILKLLYRNVRILILDEPTAVLTPKEVDALFQTIRVLAAEGRVIILVSHKLGEVLAVSDRITVLRDGRLVASVDRLQADTRSLVKMMVGGSIQLPQREGSRKPGKPMLVVHGLHVRGDRGLETVRGVDLQVCAGEIVGIAGVAGNGQRELADALAGLRKSESGDVHLDGIDVVDASPRDRIRLGLSFVPEDRLGKGLAPGLSIEENLSLKHYRRPPYSRGPLLVRRALRQRAAEVIQQFDIRGARSGFPIGLLSGGNLQRALIAREILGRPRVLVAASPTRGLDISATDAVQRILLEERARGTAILLISEDLDELLALADQILVMYEGRIAGQLAGDIANRESLGTLMAGGRQN